MTETPFQDADTELTCDVAIVGAGISGLYAAWRLVETDPDVTVCILERLDRTGGRLDSDIVEIAPGEKVREEEGGMRFNFGMEELMRLNAAMGICDQIVVFPMGTPDLPNRFAIRGHNFTLQEAADSGQLIWSELYDLAPQERGLSPTELVNTAYRNVLLANGLPYKDGLLPEDWTHFRETATWHGVAMKDWQMWGLLCAMGYSQECIQMLSETIGFAGPFKSLANAGDAFQILADFPKDPHYYTFQNEFSTLPDAIVARLHDDFGDRVKIVLSANVDCIERDGEGFELTISQAAELLNARHAVGRRTTRTVRAGHVIMATASKASQDLFHRSPALRDARDAGKLWRALYSALGMKLMKINLYYTKPWWQNGQTARLPVRFGPNFSDMPVNAVYPFYALPEEGVEPETGLPPIRDAAAALTIYCDFDNTNFWHGLQHVGPAFDSPLQRQENDRKPQVMFPASRAVVAEAQRQLGRLFGTSAVPDPVLTSYRLWDGDQDFSFAYHQWRMGVEDSSVRDYLSNPMPGLYVCNEAYSDMHGWVNGSLRSTDLALACLGKALFDRPIEPLANEGCPPPNKKDQATPVPESSRPVGVWGG